MKIRWVFMSACVALSLTSCEKEKDATSPSLIIKFRFDSTQARLNNTGEPATISAGHAALSPDLLWMGAHSVELAATANTQFNEGTVLYKATETSEGGEHAIDYSTMKGAGNDEIFLSIPLKDIKPGTYEWLRLSLAYQLANVHFSIDTTVNNELLHVESNGTLGSFLGFNSYIRKHRLSNTAVEVNGNKKQGYWGIETNPVTEGMVVPYLTTGQSPDGSTTVVNPIATTSPIPVGSSVVTGAIVPGKLTITGNETSNIVISVSFSTNKSFEWEEVDANGKWEPSKKEKVVDMGIRGIIPTIK